MSDIKAAPRTSWPRLTKGVLVYGLLVALAVMFLAPLLIVISTSLKTQVEVFAYPPTFIPQDPTFQTYVTAFQEYQLAVYFKNSTIVTVARVAGVLFFNSLVAYAFARLRWPGREIWFWLMLATMVLPDEVLLIPMFIIFRELELLGTFWPLILPRWIGSPFLIFLMRQFFKGIPEEISDAARLDGANEFQIYFRIILPMSVPILVTVALYEFMWSWNDFMNPMIYLNNKDMWTLPLGLNQIASDEFVEWGALMASALVSMLPLLVVFLALQRYFVANSANAGLKG